MEKLYDRRNLYTNIADKYNVRGFVSDKIGVKYLIPIYGVYKDVDCIPFNRLPDSFVIKPTHSSGRIKIIKDLKFVDLTELKAECKKWLKENYYYLGKEWQYKNIIPRIIIENLLLDEEGNIPLDYKFHCFNGNVEFVHVDLKRFVHHERNFYDIYWNKLDFEHEYPSGFDVLKPKNLDEMIFISQKLAEEFDYIKVDLYSTKNTIYFGELTLHPESGFGRFNPVEYDNVWGIKLNLPGLSSRNGK
jgi:hypothetical protein